MKHPTPWTLDEALAFIRGAEPEVRKRANCFLGLCGGVLRKGSSDKDLDLIIIPLNGMVAADVDEAIAALSAYGLTLQSNGIEFRRNDSALYNGQTHIPLQFFTGYFNNKRIDVCFQR